MHTHKIVLAVHVLDNADVLRDYLAWYRHIGVDLVVANDFGSTDGSQEILEDFAKQGFVKWSYHASKKTRNDSPSDRLAARARDQYGAEWVILCDTDQFLTVDGELRSILERAEREEVSVVNIDCLNMTGPPWTEGRSALDQLTLRIDRPAVESHDQQLSGQLSVPYIFLRHPPKTIVRARTFVSYAAGGHSAETTSGRGVEYPGLRFLHYPIRSYDALQTKVGHTITWFKENPHLEDWWGWHWRRWIKLQQAGLLREDYANQFVTPARAAELLRDGICSIDDTLSRWIGQHPREQRGWPGRILTRLFG